MVVGMTVMMGIVLYSSIGEDPESCQSPLSPHCLGRPTTGRELAKGFLDLLPCSRREIIL